MTSRSSKYLRDTLRALRVYPDRNYRPRNSDLIINWGNSKIPNWYREDLNILNHPNCIPNASNKLATFELLKGVVPIPEYTTERDVASTWGKVVVRHKLTGTNAQGVEIVEGNVPQAPLYTKYIPKKAEYRVHVFMGQIIDYTKKRRHIEDDPNEDQEAIRNHKNGWIFTRGNLRRLERVEQMAINAVDTLGLDFGGVDIVRDFDNNCYVLEVNTACGIQGTTLEAYKTAIQNYA